MYAPGTAFLAETPLPPMTVKNYATLSLSLSFPRVFSWRLSRRRSGMLSEEKSVRVLSLSLSTRLATWWASRGPSNSGRSLRVGSVFLYARETPRRSDSPSRFSHRPSRGKWSLNNRWALSLLSRLATRARRMSSSFHHWLTIASCYPIL